MFLKKLKMPEEIGYKEIFSKSIYMDLSMIISPDVPWEKNLSLSIKPWNSQIGTFRWMHCVVSCRTRKKGRICMTTCKKISTLWKSR